MQFLGEVYRAPFGLPSVSFWERRHPELKVYASLEETSTLLYCQLAIGFIYLMARNDANGTVIPGDGSASEVSSRHLNSYTYLPMSGEPK